MTERLLTLSARGRFVALCLLLLVSMLAALQLPRLRIDRSDERLISREDAGWPALRELQARFGAEEAVLIYLRADDLWTPARLRALEEFTLALERVPGVTSVDSMLTATNIRDKGRYVDAGPLVDIVPDDAARIAELRADALYSPLIRRTYVSDDGNGTAVMLAYAADPANPDHDLTLHAALEREIEAVRGSFDVAFQLGWPRLSAEIDRGLRRDFALLVPLAVLILVGTVTLSLRSLRVLPIPLVTSGVTILWTLGFMAAAGIPVTLLTAILPALIIVVGSVEDVHLTASYLNGLHAGHPAPRQAAIAHMARHVGPAIVVTSVTTVIGFASNVISDIPLIREFSLAAAFAMCANLVVTICAVPLMLHAFGPSASRLLRDGEQPQGLIGVIVRVIERVTERHAAKVIASVLALLIVFAWHIAQLRVNNDPMAYFPADHPFVADAARVHRDLAGLQGFGVMLQAKQPGWFKTVDGLATVARVQEVLDNQGIYDRSLSLADLMALMHQEMHAGDRAFHVPPTRQADYDLYLSSMPRSELAPLVSEDYSTALISVRHSVADSVRLNAAIDHLNSVLPTLLGAEVDFAIAGENLMINRAAESLITGEAVSLAVILAVIFCIFAVLYTSWLAGLLALVPNMIPIVINFGIMGWLGVPLNPGTAMVAAIAIGLAVDDTIHLMTRFGIESRRRVDERAAVRATIRGEAVPVLTTALALGLGFAVFGLSNFRIVAEFGLLAAGTMLYAALADLLLMPILLRHLRLATVWDIVALDVDAAVLARCPLFEGMSRYQVKKLILLSELVDFRAGDVLIAQGEVSSGMYVLLKGEVAISIDKGEGAIVIDRGVAGDLFGEIGFAGHGAARTATVTASTPVSAVLLEATKADRGLRFYPVIATRLFRNISRLLGIRLMQSHARLLNLTERVTPGQGTP